ncbi:uncharacterized protein [Procambarus clarkii]|uniref:uncharacterized protein isoform X3 n=1 Tax=Procambarus clarkii TaxID=6728 RepID=UPI0037449E55
MKPTLKCCGRSWQQSWRNLLADLQMWFGKSRSPCQLLKQNQVKVIMMHGLAWSEAALLCKRGDCLWSCLGSSVHLGASLNLKQ